MPNFEQGLFLALFLLPGYVMQRVTSLTIPALETRNTTEVLLRCLLGSAFSYAFSGPVLLVASQRGWLNGFLGLLVVGVVTLVVIPALLSAVSAVLVEKGIVKWLLERLGLPYNHPSPSAWDTAFRSVGQKATFVRVRLKSGYQVAGFFGPRSCAGTFPGPRDLFIELVYRLDQNGNLVEPLAGSQGVYLAADDILGIEFLRGGDGGDGERKGRAKACRGDLESSTESCSTRAG